MIRKRIQQFVLLLLSFLLFIIIVNCPPPVDEKPEVETEIDYSPKNFRITVREADRLTFQWDPVAGVSSYRFSREASALPLTKELMTDRPAITKLALNEAELTAVGDCDTHIFRDIQGLHKLDSTTDIKLVSNTAYDYIITMLDKGGTALAKFKFTVVTGLGLPAEFRISSKTEESVRLSWSKMQDVSGDCVYVVSRAQRSAVQPIDILEIKHSSPGTPQVQVTAEGFFFTDDELRIGGEYFYFLRTYDKLNKSYNSRQIEVVMDLSIPDSLRAVYEPANNRIALSWNAVLKSGKSKGYKVYRSYHPDQGFVLVHPKSGILTENKWNYPIDKSSDMGGRIYFRVTSVIDGKESNRSAPAFCTLPPAPCLKIDNKLIVGTSSGMMKLKWKNPGRADGIIIRRHTYEGGIEKVEEVGRYYHLFEETYTDYGLDPNREYSYSVTSFVKATDTNNKIYDNESTAIEGTDYSNPLDIQGSQVTLTPFTGSVEIRCPALTDGNLSYVLQLKNSVTGKYEPLYLSKVTKTISGKKYFVYTHGSLTKPLKSLTSYSYKIDVQHSVSNKKTINPIEREVTTCPPAPEGLSVVDQDSSSITIRWKKLKDVDASVYKVDYLVQCLDSTGKELTELTDPKIAISKPKEVPIASITYYESTVSNLPQANSRYVFNLFTTAQDVQLSKPPMKSTDSATKQGYTCPKDVGLTDIISIEQKTDSIKITFKKPVELNTKYEVRYKKGLNGAYSNLNGPWEFNADGTGIEINHTGLAAFTTYYYEVLLVNTANNLKSKNSYVTEPITTCPPAPTGPLAISGETIDSMVLEWGEAPSISHPNYTYTYVVDCTDDSGPVPITVTPETALAGKRKVTISGLPKTNTKYGFKVYTVVNGTNIPQDFKSTKSIGKDAYTCPGDPTISNAVANGNNVTLTISGDADVYEVWYSKDAAFGSVNKVTLLATKVSPGVYTVVVPNVYCLTTNYLKLRAYNSESNFFSGFSNDVNVVTGISNATITLSTDEVYGAYVTGSGTVSGYKGTISWGKINGITSYKLKVEVVGAYPDTKEITTGFTASGNSLSYSSYVVRVNDSLEEATITYTVYAIDASNGQHNIGTASKKYPLP